MKPFIDNFKSFGEKKQKSALVRALVEFHIREEILTEYYKNMADEWWSIAITGRFRDGTIPPSLSKDPLLIGLTSHTVLKTAGYIDSLKEWLDKQEL